jgi:hypothetical protein
MILGYVGTNKTTRQQAAVFFGFTSFIQAVAPRTY